MLNLVVVNCLFSTYLAPHQERSLYLSARLHINFVTSVRQLGNVKLTRWQLLRHSRLIMSHNLFYCLFCIIGGFTKFLAVTILFDSSVIVTNWRGDNCFITGALLRPITNHVSVQIQKQISYAFIIGDIPQRTAEGCRCLPLRSSSVRYFRGYVHDPNARSIVNSRSRFVLKVLDNDQRTI